MQPWKTLDSHPTRDGTLILRQRGERDFLLSIDGRVLMSSMLHRSEDALAKLAVERLTKPGPRVLTAGLGLGFTVRALLDALDRRASVQVCELYEPIIDWCAGPLGAVNGAVLDDPRLSVTIGDVMHTVRGAAESGRGFDAIVLDLMEGPSASRGQATAHLYGPRALEMVRAALAPGGIYAVWGEEDHPGFPDKLRRCGFDARRVIVGKGGPKHVVYIAQPSRGPRGGELAHGGAVSEGATPDRSPRSAPRSGDRERAPRRPRR